MPVGLEDGIGLCGDQCISEIPQEVCFSFKTSVFSYAGALMMNIRVFHEHTKLAILALMPTLYSYIYGFLGYLHLMLLVNVKLNVTGYKRIILKLQISLV